jgi:hypothetical protein
VVDVSHNILPYVKHVYIPLYYTSQDGMPHVDDIIHHVWQRSYSHWGQYISYVMSVLRDGSIHRLAGPASNSRDGNIDESVGGGFSRGMRMRMGQQSSYYSHDGYRLLHYRLQRFLFLHHHHCHRTTTT